MQWTARNIIMVVTLVLTATLAPIGWLIQKYWIHGNGEQDTMQQDRMVEAYSDPNSQSTHLAAVHQGEHRTKSI